MYKLYENLNIKGGLQKNFIFKRNSLSKILVNLKRKFMHLTNNKYSTSKKINAHLF